MFYEVAAFNAQGVEIGARTCGSQSKTLEAVARTRLTEDGARLVVLKAMERGAVVAHRTVRSVREAVAFFNNNI